MIIPRNCKNLAGKHREQNDMKQIKTNSAIALTLLPAFFIIHNCNELFGFLSIRQIILYTLCIYVIIVILFIVVQRKMHSTSKTGVLLFLLSSFLLFFTPIHSTAKTISFHTYSFVYPLLMILISLLLAWISWKIISMPAIKNNVIYFLNILMICLIISELTDLVVNTTAFKKNGNLIYSSRELANNYKRSNLPDSSKPDIYFLVFDEYTNSKTLKKIWQFNNDDIGRWLHAKGFYIPENTRANYSFTLYSISSTFNMDYISRAKGSDGTIKKNLLQANQSLSDNELFSILEKENYNIHFLAPFKNKFGENGMGGWFNYIVDRQLSMQTLPGKLWNEFEMRYNASSSNKGFVSALNEKYQLLQRTLHQVDSTANLVTDRKPQFVYGHFMIPHEPHLFDVDGGLLDQKKEIPPLVKTYPAQIAFVNDLVRQIVDHILQKNKRNTIIIVEGDHGFRRFLEGENWFLQTSDSLKQYFLPNFSAVYFPDSDYRRLYDTISPVNIFRVVLNQYFDQQFPLLKDSSILVKDE